MPRDSSMHQHGACQHARSKYHSHAIAYAWRQKSLTNHDRTGQKTVRHEETPSKTSASPAVRGKQGPPRDLKPNHRADERHGIALNKKHPGVFGGLVVLTSKRTWPHLEPGGASSASLCRRGTTFGSLWESTQTLASQALMHYGCASAVPGIGVVPACKRSDQKTVIF